MPLAAGAHPGRVVLAVADLKRSIAYYREVIGLQVLDAGDGHAILGPQHAARALVELRETPGVRPVPARGRLGLYHFAILVPDRAALGRFLAHLGSLGIHPGMSDHLVSEALYLSDPDGLGIEVYADRGRETWRYAHGQLVMALDPLDVGDVIEAGRGEPWTGMPEATVMGHVHLFVGDLDSASAFYHDAIGLDRTVWAYPGALFLSAGGYHHHLGVNTWAAGAPRAGEGDARMLEWELLVPSAGDVAAAAARLTAAGAEIASVERDCLARDPWGTAVRIRTPAS